ncbi:MAG: hypothetical protein ABJP48_07015 [Erythrobacter sp.]
MIGTLNNYDGRGNLTNSGSDVFAYSSENFLTSVAGEVNLTYDPFGRLYETNGTPGGGGLTRFAYDGVDMIGGSEAERALARTTQLRQSASAALCAWVWHR